MTYHSKHVKYSFLILSSILIGILSCKKDIEIPTSSTNTKAITFEVPMGWPTPYYQFVNNQLTRNGFELGRKLFYDTKLSKDNTVSCGTCHQNFAAFANAGHDLSHGVYGLLGKRNSQPLFNLNWHPSFMWDGGVNHIEVQPLTPITNPVEMGENMNNIIEKLKKEASYQQAFTLAYGDPEVSTARIFKALTQFMGAMVSSESKWDQYTRGKANLTSSEAAGEAIFQAQCASCHPAPLFTDFSFRNKGLATNNLHDSGRAVITGLAEDLYKFKVPSLRNLSYTAPYGHDGRFASLDDVFDQMQDKVTHSPSLDPLLSNGITLTAQERAYLKAFLTTLDDEAFTKDQRFSEPLP